LWGSEAGAGGVRGAGQWAELKLRSYISGFTAVVAMARRFTKGETDGAEAGMIGLTHSRPRRENAGALRTRLNYLIGSFII